MSDAQTFVLPLAQLRAHPLNSNVMPEDKLTKLAGHLERTGRYPPVIVRRLHEAGDDGRAVYQILDGHHRVAALERIGRTSARCMAWDVDDDEALLLLGTLNRLQGRDDERKRARLVSELSQRVAVEDLQRQLPEAREGLDRLLALHEPPPTPRPPQPLSEMPVAVHFFLLPEQRSRLERRLRALDENREAALMRLIECEGGSRCG